MSDYKPPSYEYPHPRVPFGDYSQVDPMTHPDSLPDAAFIRQTRILSDAFGSLKDGGVLSAFLPYDQEVMLRAPELPAQEIGSLFVGQEVFTPTQAPVYQELLPRELHGQLIETTPYTHSVLGLVNIPFRDRAGWVLHPAALLGGLYIGHGQNRDRWPQGPGLLNVLRAPGFDHLLNGRATVHTARQVTLTGLAQVATMRRSRVNGARVYAAVALPETNQGEQQVQYSFLQGPDESGQLGLVNQRDNGRPPRRIDPADFLEQWDVAEKAAVLIITHDQRKRPVLDSSPDQPRERGPAVITGTSYL